MTQGVFGQDGGHVGDNEAAFIQAIDPTLVHPERYGPELTTAYPTPKTWSAYPCPSSIGLYKEGQGQPHFDAQKARLYFTKVNEAGPPDRKHHPQVESGRPVSRLTRGVNFAKFEGK